MEDKWPRRFQVLFWLLLLTVCGLICACGIFLLDLVKPEASGGPEWIILAVMSLILVAPGLVDLYCVTIWHWKARYRGRHSDLWGALILIETSGWFKLVYLFRHIIPDAQGRGRYRRAASVPEH
jgi:H+/Cl- antiporter ClcA